MLCWFQMYCTVIQLYISPPGSSVCGILQDRILERVAIPFSRDLLNPGTEPRSPALQGRLLTL